VRILFSGPGAAGHVFPMVPTAQALRAAGHDVLFAGAAPVELLRTIGLPAVDVGDGSTVADAFRKAAGGANYRSEGRSEEEALRAAAVGFAEHSRSTLPGLDALASSWLPDVMVHAACQGAAPLVARKLKTPAVVHNFGVVSGLWFAGQVAANLASEYRAQGLDPDEAAERTVLDVVPESLGGDGTGWRVRYVPFNGGGVVPAELFGPRERPRVAVTLGTVLTEHDGVRSILQLVDQAAAVDAEFLLAVGGTDLGPLGALPDNVRALPWVPLAGLLAASDAIVHHGGSGTMMTAAVAGVPQLILPQGADHFTNAAAAEARGFALSAADPAVDGDLLRRLLHDDELRKAAVSTREEIAALTSPAQLVREFEELLDTAR
jgi:UDP:flavonoid glycosyltransferase YjiC (YdhE family)